MKLFLVVMDATVTSMNMFIAVIGITAAPTFISGIKEVGFMLFFAGVLSTTLPLVIGVWMGNRIFKFHPAINLGCCAGARTTTASLGAIQDAINSDVPARTGSPGCLPDGLLWRLLERR